MGTLVWLSSLVLCLGLAVGYRLPDSVVPAEYKLDIITNLGDEDNKFNFSGKVWIEAICGGATNKITLHSKKLKIHDGEIYVKPLHSKKKKNVKISGVEFVEDDDFLIINLAEALKEGHRYEIYIPFSGDIEEGLAGYYRSQYTDKATNETRWLAVTQFEPSDARRAFPCFDEPAMKAKFTISLGKHKKYSSISNMPLLKTEEMKEKKEWEWDVFETSVPMSTYLVAYVVSDFDFETSPKSRNNVTFRTWARKDALSQVEFAKDIGPKILEFYEDYFKIDYPLPKQDMIAIPDFSAGAMENWGLITYRETYLLYDSKVSSVSNKVSVASVVAHELAHQWFGNLVTMKWWTDLWLNEGFATYMAAVAVDNLFPEWNSLKEETVDNLLSVFSFDSLQKSHPVSVPIGNPKEIAEIFDTISYKKGSYLLHMMANFLGQETLREGVSNYLKLHKYDNAEQDDLWASITEEAHKNGVLPLNLTTKTIMDTWTLQTGYPVITVTRKYGQNLIEVNQERFIRDNVQKRSSSPYWWVPLSYTSEDKLEFKITKPKYWLPANDKIQNLTAFAEDNQWIIFNIGASGLYRVNYDEKNWNLLISALKSDSFQKIPILNRVLLIDDAASLSWIGALDYKIFFDVVSYLQRENEYLPWKAALKSINVIDSLLKRTSTYGQFKDYMRKMIGPIFGRIGGFHKLQEKDNRLDSIQHRVLVTATACKFNVDHCVMESKDLFKNLQENPKDNEQIPKDLRGVIYCNGIKYGTEHEWNFLWGQYLTSNVATEKNAILKSLGCTRQNWLLQRYLEWTIESDSGIRKQDITTVFASVITNDSGFYIARNFLQENIKKLYERLQPTINKLSSIISLLATYMTSDNDYEWLRNFTQSNNEYFNEIKNGVEQALETAKLNAQWHKDNLHGVNDLLRTYKQ